ncbi:MAG: hydrogenase maturation nickel metallochaperone HypA [Chlorobium sp.]|uniref:hydrogenase maturation nickel metallochaperone HypA n=1 Tax=Chlorobium sp. TaxID=1095 RepID=UPI002F42A4ED
MHEMSVALSIVEAAEARARREGSGVISEIALVVGRLAGVVPDALRFCFPAASRGTLAEDAVLVIEEREGRGVCVSCGASFAVSFHVAECPECRSLAVRVVSGDEFIIESITIEEGE